MTVIAAGKGVFRPENTTAKTMDLFVYSVPMLGSQKVEREIVGCVSGSKTCNSREDK
jgi:hypothetical protein